MLILSTCNGNLGTCCTDPGMIVILSIMRNLLTIIQIAIPILLMIYASIEFAKLVRDPNMKDGLKRVKNKFLAAAIVFFIPMFIDVLLNMLPNSFSLTSCWESATNRSELSGSTMPTYLDPTGNNNPKSTLYTKPDEYEKGKPKSTTNNIGSTNSSTTGSNQSSTSSSTSTSSSSSSTSNSAQSSSTNSESTTSSTQQGTISGADVIAYARKFKGQAYERGGYWNGEMPYTPTDCVGFVKGVYKHFGINIPSNTSSLYNSPKKFTVVTGQPVKAGDIVIYAHHRALITGNGNQVIHAMGEAYGIGQSKNYKSCGSGDVIAVVRVNKVY